MIQATALHQPKLAPRSPLEQAVLSSARLPAFLPPAFLPHLALLFSLTTLYISHVTMHIALDETVKRSQRQGAREP